MTRDEAKLIVRKAHFNCDDPNGEGEEAVNRIYDDFEAKTCENCRYLDSYMCERNDLNEIFNPAIQSCLYQEPKL